MIYYDFNVWLKSFVYILKKFEMAFLCDQNKCKWQFEKIIRVLSDDGRRKL